VLGIGAGWYELEHRQLGYEFGTFTDRFARLEEALSIIEPMLRGERPTVDGRWYRTENAMNEPRIRDDLPIMLGGSGEKKTFGMAARHAQHLNIICAPEDLPRKLEALAERCAEIGRDRSTLETSFLTSVIIDEDGDKAREQQRAYLRARGVDPDSDNPAVRSAMARQFVGTPDEVAAGIKERVLDPGVDGIIVNMPVTGHTPGAVTLAAKTLAPLVK
jgi:alkanesulfonate monooxygenase SsuD/methylene tetrahydromethanopterin reductase-like flavin-dependent oxidoreductase (luciferase family)